MLVQPQYDVAIIGGGLAGLSLAIQLAQKNLSVVLLEKEKYPFHKVCGEYISMESWNFLEQLGVPLTSLQLPRIQKLQLTAPNGTSFTTQLPLGGFGISRYTLDEILFSLAKAAGVTVAEETKVEQVNFMEEKFCLQISTKKSVNTKQIEATVCCGAYGKRSNLDVKWKRAFVQKTNPHINNYVGVKYHVQTDWPTDCIGLHNFSDGYCGISKIDAGNYCLCYLTTANNLKKSNHSIKEMQEKILFQNPALKKIFLNSEIAFGFPLTISQISFSKKPLIEQHILMVGDAAGMITPLCGNGMSMALHASKVAARQIQLFLAKHINREAMEKNYQQQWRSLFAPRLYTGRVLQSFFGSPLLSNVFVQVFKTLPFLAQGVIKKTHGADF